MTTNATPARSVIVPMLPGLAIDDYAVLRGKQTGETVLAIGLCAGTPVDAVIRVSNDDALLVRATGDERMLVNPTPEALNLLRQAERVHVMEQYEEEAVVLYEARVMPA